MSEREVQTKSLSEVLDKRLAEVNALLDQLGEPARLELEARPPGPRQGWRAVQYHIKIKHLFGPQLTQPQRIHAGIFSNTMTALDMMYAYLHCEVERRALEVLL